MSIVTIIMLPESVVMEDSTNQSAGPFTSRQSTDQCIMEELQRMESLFIRSVFDWVDQLSETVNGSPTRKRPAESRRGYWSDRSDWVSNTVVSWYDEEGKGDGEAPTSGTIEY